MSAELPLSGPAAWWATAWLAGRVGTDHVLDEVPLRVADLARLRASGARAVGLALPVEGDPLGLGGPAPLTAAALDAAEALVADSGLALVPVDREGLVVWVEYAAARRQVPDLGEADRGLRAALVASARALADLDVARWRPEVADEVLALGRPGHVDTPPGVPSVCGPLAVKAARCLAIVDLALADDGAAVSATEARARRDALTPLERAARRAMVAACSPEAWPPADPRDRGD